MHRQASHQVYEFLGSRWVDRGTAIYLSQFQKKVKKHFLLLVPTDIMTRVIPRTAIPADDVYPRQDREFQLPLEAAFHLAPSLLPAHNLPTMLPSLWAPLC